MNWTLNKSYDYPKLQIPFYQIIQIVASSFLVECFQLKLKFKNGGKMIFKWLDG